MDSTTSLTARNIKGWMSQQGVTNGMIAAAHQPKPVTREMVSYAIHGKRTSAPILKTIARLCRVSLADLLAGPANTTTQYREAA